MAKRKRKATRKRKGKPVLDNEDALQDSWATALHKQAAKVDVHGPGLDEWRDGQNRDAENDLFGAMIDLRAVRNGLESARYRIDKVLALIDTADRKNALWHIENMCGWIHRDAERAARTATKMFVGHQEAYDKIRAAHAVSTLAKREAGRA